MNSKHFQGYENRENLEFPLINGFSRLILRDPRIVKSVILQSEFAETPNIETRKNADDQSKQEG